VLFLSVTGWCKDKEK